MIIPTFANANLDAALSSATGRGGNVGNGSFGVGDMFVQPVWLGKTLPHWDFALAYGFYAPIGKYDQARRLCPAALPSRRNRWTISDSASGRSSSRAR